MVALRQRFGISLVYLNTPVPRRTYRRSHPLHLGTLAGVCVRVSVSFPRPRHLYLLHCADVRERDAAKLVATAAAPGLGRGLFNCRPPPPGTRKIRELSYSRTRSGMSCVTRRARRARVSSEAFAGSDAL